MPELLTVSQVAQRLGFREWAIRRAIADGRLTAHKPCGRLRISEDAIAEFLASARVAPSAPARRPVVAVNTSRSYPAAGSFRARLRAKEQGG